MCLVIKRISFKKTAKEDIVVYKLVRKYEHVYWDGNREVRFKTPYRNMTVDMGLEFEDKFEDKNPIIARIIIF